MRARIVFVRVAFLLVVPSCAWAQSVLCDSVKDSQASLECMKAQIARWDARKEIERGNADARKAMFQHWAGATAASGGHTGFETSLIVRKAARAEAQGLAAQANRPVNADPALIAAAEELAKRCDAGEPDSCVELGTAYYRGDGVPRNLQRSDFLYRKGCVGGATQGCAYLAVAYDRTHPKEAAELYARSCFGSGGSSVACAFLGSMYEAGRGVSADKAKAAGLYRKFCDAWKGDQDSCVEWSRLQAQGIVPAEVDSLFQHSSNPPRPSEPPANPGPLG
jgi:TPR repeat protein